MRRGPWITFLSLAVGLFLAACVVRLVGVSPVAAAKTLFRGGMGDGSAWSETLVKATPLLLAAGGLCVAFRARYWNIGAEGQICAGAVACAWLALRMPPMPGLLAIPALLCLGGLAGAALGAVSGALRAYRGVNEIITTIMMNYVALHAVGYLVEGPMRDPAGYLPESAEVPSWLWLPSLPHARIHAGFPLALLSLILLTVLLKKTVLGFTWETVGHNARAAAFAGIPVRRTLLSVAAWSGGMAGIAGAVEVLGIHFRLREMISSGYGFTAIAVALLGRAHPVGVFFAGVLLAAFQVGADRMERELSVSSSVVLFLQALIVLSVLTGETIRSRWEESQGGGGT